MDKWLKSKHYSSPNNSSIEKSTLTEQPSGNMEKTKTNHSSIKRENTMKVTYNTNLCIPA